MEIIVGVTVRLDSADLFSLGIGKRVLKSQITGTGIPIYSANVNEPFGHIEDAIFNDYSVGTVIWGIDGDWNVNYIPPETPFYPTDHCGTLRVLTDDINPHYMAFALKREVNGKDLHVLTALLPVVLKRCGSQFLIGTNKMHLLKKLTRLTVK